MRRLIPLLPLVICFALPLSAEARTTPSPEIRHVQTDSTDIFEVLTILREAQGALERRDYFAARQGFETVLMHDPDMEAARSGLRRSFIALGNIEAAQALMTDKTSADSIIIRIQSGEVENPVDLLKSALKTDPDPRLWTLLGRLQDMQSAHSSARQSYAMASLAGARPGLAENNIGQSHWLAGEYELALSAFTKAADLDRSDMQFDNNRRRALIRLGRTQDALAGLNAERAGLFLAQAGDKAAAENEIELAQLLYQKSLDIAPRYNPVTSKKLARLK